MFIVALNQPYSVRFDDCIRVFLQVVYSNVYMLDGGNQWKELPSMPKPDSHIEFAWVNVNNSIIIAGGTTEKHPVTKKMVLVGEIFRFDLNKLVSILPIILFCYFMWILICFFSSLIWKYNFVTVTMHGIDLFQTNNTKHMHKLHDI